MKKRLLSALILALVSILVLQACSNNSSSGSDSGKVKLVWWAHDNPAFVKANKKFIEDYTAENPNVEIDLQIFPYDAFVQKLKTAYAGNAAPDIAQVFGSWAPQYIKNGHLSPVPDIYADKLETDFFEPALGAYTKDGTIYGIPQEYNLENGGMLASPDMFKEAGIEYPTTWDELVDASIKLTKTENNKITTKGFEFVSGDNITFMFLSLILQQGGEYLTADGHVNFSTPEATKAMGEMKRFLTEYKVTDFRDFGGDLDSSDFFFTGKSAMVLRGPWTIAEGQENYELGEFDYIPMPAYEDSQPYFAAETGWGEIVAKSSKHQEEAWKFVNYMTEKEQSKYFNITTFTVPANIAAAEDPELLEALPKMKTSLDILEYGKYIGDFDTDFFKQQVNDNFQLIVDEKLSIDDGLKKIETEINNMVDKQK